MRCTLGLVALCGTLVPSVSATAAISSPPRASKAEPAECDDAGRASEDPLAELRESDLALSAALKRRVPDWSPEAPVLEARIERLLGQILDYDSIARSALGPHWDALTNDQRSAFLALFSPLTNGALIAAAERRISVVYESETISGPEATVVVTPRLLEAEGGPVTRVEYKLAGRCGRWRIHDVLVDGVSLVDGYRAQFDRLFRRGSFDDLLATMRRKLHHL
jgi:phospholipid transport system substrate-binding protein